MKIVKVNNHTLINADCLDAMEYLISIGTKVDAIITDPPYNIARDNNFDSMGRRGIDFGEWDKGFDITGWLKYIPKLLKEDGSVVIFNDWKNLGTIARALEQLDFDIKDMIRFVKTNPMPRNRDRRYITDYEVALWAVPKNAKWVFNRINPNYERPEFIDNIEREQVHPTQKPVSLMQHLIRIHSNEAHTILDPFMGSGTTGVACQKDDRNFIGIEIDPNYFEIARVRVKTESQQTNLF